MKYIHNFGWKPPRKDATFRDPNIEEKITLKGILDK
jgi:hypothetical protein